MKRFHVHLSVTDLDKSVEFYSKLFGSEPTKRQRDYAKWMLDNPRMNFAISARGHSSGLNHFGFQVDSPEELSQIRAFAESASNAQVTDQGEATCCYAKSDKHWIIDPVGIAWEHFHTRFDVQEFGSDTATTHDAACCIPLNNTANTEHVSCCIPHDQSKQHGRCCD